MNLPIENYGLGYTLTLIILLLLTGCEKLQYPIGRDTAHAFGDGRYQIFHSSGPSLELCDVAENKLLIFDMQKWVKTKNNIYVISLDNSKKIYTILNIKENTLEKYENFYDIPLVYINEFHKLDYKIKQRSGASK